MRSPFSGQCPISSLRECRNTPRVVEQSLKKTHKHVFCFFVHRSPSHITQAKFIGRQRQFSSSRGFFVGSEASEVYPPSKLTYKLKNDGWKMKCPLKMVPFQGTFVHFRGVSIPDLGHESGRSIGFHSCAYHQCIWDRAIHKPQGRLEVITRI